jgi:hypothetical protein
MLKKCKFGMPKLRNNIVEYLLASDAFPIALTLMPLQLLLNWSYYLYIPLNNLFLFYE